jgi:hypothetical protein
MSHGARRADRLRGARPELAAQIPRQISVKRACEIGGYADSRAFVKDMKKRGF